MLERERVLVALLCDSEGATHSELPESETASLSVRPLLRLARSESCREAGQ